MAKEFPKLLKLEEVLVGSYKSRRGGYIKLRFERDRFTYVHFATPELLEFWETQVGCYYWVQGSYVRGIDIDVEYREYRLWERA